MNIIQQFILGFIQAVLEWLPVSSEGFIILAAVNGFGENSAIALRIALYFHLGTALAVAIRYRKLYWDALTKDREMLRFLIISTAATGIVGVPLYLLLGDIFSEFNGGLIITLFIGITLLITATLLRTGKIKAKDSLIMEERTIKDEITLGICQGFAILPGISRSGTTVSFLLLKGYKKEDSFKMSFIISLPAIIAAVIFDFIFEESPGELGINWTFILVIIYVAIVGYFTMDILIKYARKVSFDKICYILGFMTISLVIILLIFGDFS